MGNKETIDEKKSSDEYEGYRRIAEESANITPDSEWIVISAKWFTAWRKWAGNFDDTYSANTTIENGIAVHPGKISIKGLLDTSKDLLEDPSPPN